MTDNITNAEGCGDLAMEFVEFIELIDSKKEAGPGPDGFSYAAWETAGTDRKRILYNSYCGIMRYGSCPPDFNHALLVFIGKASNNDVQLVSTRPE